MKDPDDKSPLSPNSSPADAPRIARRDLLGRVSLAVIAVPALALAVPVAGFVVAPLFRPVPRLWRTVGKLKDFQVGDTVAVKFTDASPLPWSGVTADTAAWLRRSADREFLAFSVNCAHLGCPVRWLKEAKLFMCPCHGGVYYENGEVAAGPPPHGLAKYPVRIVNEDVQIQTGPIPIG
ncbi:MAG: Rieske (2Fe-2S) protein [Polyangiaceae bacterium]